MSVWRHSHCDVGAGEELPTVELVRRADFTQSIDLK